MALVNTVASSAPMRGKPEGDEHDRRKIGASGSGKPQTAEPDNEHDGEDGDPGLARLAGIGDGAEHRREHRGDQLGDAGGIGPQRRAPRRIGHEAVDEIGREQKGDDERVEGLRRPIEQHPAEQRALVCLPATCPERGPSCQGRP